MTEEVKVARVEPDREKVPHPDGAWTRMAGGKEYLMPPLPFRLLRAHKDDMEAIGAPSAGGIMGLEKMDRIITVVHAAMLLNYPALSRDDVEDLLNMENFKYVYAALMGVSGLIRKEPDKGEAQAASR